MADPTHTKVAALAMDIKGIVKRSGIQPYPPLADTQCGRCGGALRLWDVKDGAPIAECTECRERVLSAWRDEEAAQ